MNNQDRDKAEKQNATKNRFEWLFQQHRKYYEKQTKQDLNISFIRQ